MQVVKLRSVRIEEQERIVRKDVAAMVRNCLNDGKGAKKHGLPGCELRDGVCENKGDNVEEKRLEGMGVYGAVGVGYVEEMVAGMDDAVESFVHVAKPVGKVDPGINDCEGDEVLEGWNGDMYDHFGK